MAFEKSFKSLVAEYIATGQTISANSLVKFVNDKVKLSEIDRSFLTNINKATGVNYATGKGTLNSRNCSAIAVDSVTVLLSYIDEGDSNKCKAVVLKISDLEITIGTVYTISSNSSNYVEVCKVNVDSCAITWADNSANGKIVNAKILGTVIILGASSNFIGANALYISSIDVATDKVYISYRLASDGKGYGVVCTLGVDSAWTIGTPIKFQDSSTAFSSVAKMGTNKAVTVYIDAGDSNKGKSIVCTISETVPTFGSVAEFSASNMGSGYLQATRLADDAFFIAYKDEGTTNYGYGIAGTISTTTITFGTSVAVNAEAITNIKCIATSSTQVLITYTNASINLLAIIANITGTTVTYNTAVTLDSLSNTRNLWLAYIDSGRIIHIGSLGDIESRAIILYGDSYDKRYEGVALSNETLSRVICVRRF